MPRRVDNSAHAAKIAARRAIADALPSSARVFELLAGNGVLYQAVWRRFSKGACIDRDPVRAARAARHRPTWAVCEADAEVAVGAGWMGHVPFDVLDIDTWGEPWRFLRAWCRSSRARAPETYVILTDGWIGHRNITWPRSLFGPTERPHLTEGQALDLIRDRVGAWAAESGGRVRDFASKRANASIALYRLVVVYGDSRES